MIKWLTPPLPPILSRNIWTELATFWYFWRRSTENQSLDLCHKFHKNQRMATSVTYNPYCKGYFSYPKPKWIITGALNYIFNPLCPLLRRYVIFGGPPFLGTAIHDNFEDPNPPPRGSKMIKWVTPPLPLCVSRNIWTAPYIHIGKQKKDLHKVQIFILL